MKLSDTTRLLIAGEPRPQAAAPVRTHGTVFAVSDMDDAIARVQRGGYRHWLDAANDLMPHHRLWVGVSEEEKDVWIPGDDGGLLIELVESVTIPGVMEAAGEPPPLPELPPLSVPASTTAALTTMWMGTDTVPLVEAGSEMPMVVS